MHREILQAPKGMFVDHINRNSLDNRRSNLRIVTPRENTRNNGNPTPCVTWHKSNKKWQVVVYRDGKQKHLGYFKTREEAAKVEV